MRPLSWLLKAFIFFTLFAFALNNQQPVTVRWFFGAQWQAPMVIVVLVAFAAGCAVGVAAMLPSQLRRWQMHRRAKVTAPAPPAPPPTSVMPSEFGAEHPPRIGL
jgi:lipopolysaccharide assembly protein A